MIHDDSKDGRLSRGDIMDNNAHAIVVELECGRNSFGNDQLDLD